MNELPSYWLKEGSTWVVAGAYWLKQPLEMGQRGPKPANKSEVHSFVKANNCIILFSRSKRKKNEKKMEDFRENNKN